MPLSLSLSLSLRLIYDFVVALHARTTDEATTVECGVRTAAAQCSGWLIGVNTLSLSHSLGYKDGQNIIFRV